MALHDFCLWKPKSAGAAGFGSNVPNLTYPKQPWLLHASTAFLFLRLKFKLFQGVQKSAKI